MSPSKVNGDYADLSDYDETSPLSRRSTQDTKGWNAFRVDEHISGSQSESSQNYLVVVVQILKVLAYLITFAFVLGCGVAAKCLTLLMTSQLKRKKELAVCSSYHEQLSPHKEYVAIIPEEENVAWAWALCFAFMIPELGALFRSVRMCYFKKWSKPYFSDFFVVAIFDTLSTVGMGLLVYIVLPELDVIKGAMLTNCLASIPGLFGVLSRNRKESRLFAKVLIDILALMAQVSGFALWPIVEYNKNPKEASWHIWIIPVAVLLTSCGWWENFVEDKSKFGMIRYLGSIKNRLHRTRYFIYLFVSTWKILVFFGVMIFTMSSRLESFTKIFELKPAFSSHTINITEKLQLQPRDHPTDALDINHLPVYIPIPSEAIVPFYVFLIQAGIAYLCYIFGKFACKICIQGFSFAFPVNLTIPVSITLLISACGLRHGDVCHFDFLPAYIFWECRNGNSLKDFLNDYAWVWLFWLLSQTWITLHIWTPNNERIASTEKLFVAPTYSALVIDQDLALNQRREKEHEVKTNDLNFKPDEEELDQNSLYYESLSTHTDASNANNSKVKSSDNIPKIYATATMWHENLTEMMEMLKSIFRMDEDQCARRIAQQYIEVVDPDYYNFETHIFFDDAFEMADEDENETVINSYVKNLVSQMDRAAQNVHQTSVRVRPPKKYPTPYGGRLVWTLPGKTMINCHLKDKSKIRHKKRWSQVMYMYYLLGYKIMDRSISVERKEIIAGNTFLLTLDGDIDFAPKAVTLLVDLMKKNANLGAACGRIHPVGSGMMAWYQRFEYAIGHWFQKATEHMIGCVLCSPGCFSLFRGKALMDNNVMAKYTTKSECAIHYVQYDQGEDRWLCTLLLQRGYRVEYSAAADAYTHCPEGFGEFYNQRRRWVPSTIANIMDLLQNYKQTVKINDNISLPYITYQAMLMAGTILGPGTIFLMLVGSFVAAFKIGNWVAFQYNIVPIIVFIVVCFTMKKQHQLIIAQIMSAAYALIMMAVIVGTTLQMREDGIESPSAIFLVSTTGSFFIAAVMHPQEFSCILYGFLYLLSIPSMYLLLIIYSLINLNDVSWGTREAPTKKTKKELDAERKAAEVAKKHGHNSEFLNFLNRGNDDNAKGSFELSFAGLFKLLLCVQDVPDKTQKISEEVESINKKLDTLMLALTGGTHERKKSLGHHHHHHKGSSYAGQSSKEESSDGDFEDDESEQSGLREERDDLKNPYWIEDRALKRGEVDFLSDSEIKFWKELIEEYLHPLDKNVQEQARVESELKELRNKSVFAFFMLNALFILVVFLLQLNKDQIHITWPFGVRLNVTIIPETGQKLYSKEYLQLEPIGLVFVFFFALILIIQFIAMLFHRFGTITHILASTELTCCRGEVEIAGHEDLDKNGLTIIRNMQRLKGIDGECESDDYNIGQVGDRKTVRNLERYRRRKPAVTTLDVAFRERFNRLAKDEAMLDIGLRPETMKALTERGNNVDERKRSKMETLDPKKPRTRASLASDADNYRVFTPNGRGKVNEGYEDVSEIYGSHPPSVRSSVRNADIAYLP